jgi:hypothetical protein
VKVRDAYDNIERVITYGFLSARISFRGHDLLIKNISDKEYQQMLMLCSDTDRYKLNIFSLAFSTISIDGFNVLENRNETLAEILKFYRRSPALLVLKVVDVINELNQTYIDSLSFLEGFSYSDRSRYLWSVVNPYRRSEYVGMRGLDTIGINSVTENWISINKRLDDEHIYERDFNNTLLIVGASNYKSAKMLSKSFEAHSQELKELRDDIRKYGYDRKRVEKNNQKREEWTAPLTTREDLVKELYRQMSGDKDKHDLYIDQWIENQKKKAELVKKSVEDKQMAFRHKVESGELDLLEPSKPISQYELNKRLEQNKKLDNTYMSGKEGSEIQERVLKRISAKVIRPEMKDAANG